MLDHAVPVWVIGRQMEIRIDVGYVSRPICLLFVDGRQIGLLLSIFCKRVL